MTTIAYFAHLDNVIEGLALRTSTGAVHFIDHATAQWQTLTNADAPRLQLHGRCDLAAAQALADGDLVVKASRTMQEVRA